MVSPLLGKTTSRPVAAVKSIWVSIMSITDVSVVEHTIVVKIHWTVFGNPDQFIARTNVLVVDNIDIFVNLALWQSLQMVEKSTC